MFDVPMQVTEEKKHYPTAPVKSRQLMACERCVYGSGEHTCQVAGEVVTTPLCECGHPIECHSGTSSVGCMVPASNGIGFCECERAGDQPGHNYALAQALGAAERRG
jgi:hypothetical protein